jgi:hypothetical protein
LSLQDKHLYKQLQHTFEDNMERPRCFLLFSLIAALLAAIAPVHGQGEQLDLARVTQQVQRQEFPLVGEGTAFKFSFADVVRRHLAA